MNNSIGSFRLESLKIICEQEDTPSWIKCLYDEIKPKDPEQKTIDIDCYLIILKCRDCPMWLRKFCVFARKFAVNKSLPKENIETTVIGYKKKYNSDIIQFSQKSANEMCDTLIKLVDDIISNKDYAYYKSAFGADVFDTSNIQKLVSKITNFIEKNNSLNERYTKELELISKHQETTARHLEQYERLYTYLNVTCQFIKSSDLNQEITKEICVDIFTRMLNNINDIKESLSFFKFMNIKKLKSKVREATEYSKKPEQNKNKLFHLMEYIYVGKLLCTLYIFEIDKEIKPTIKIPNIKKKPDLVVLNRLNPWSLIRIIEEYQKKWSDDTTKLLKVNSDLIEGLNSLMHQKQIVSNQ